MSMQINHLQPAQDWHVICITKNPKEAGMRMSATLDIGTGCLKQTGLTI
jgi:hypothetical protein